jgi:hypothetical protein
VASERRHHELDGRVTERVVGFENARRTTARTLGPPRRPIRAVPRAWPPAAATASQRPPFRRFRVRFGRRRPDVVRSGPARRVSTPAGGEIVRPPSCRRGLPASGGPPRRADGRVGRSSNRTPTLLVGDPRRDVPHRRCMPVAHPTCPSAGRRSGSRLGRRRSTDHERGHGACRRPGGGSSVYRARRRDRGSAPLVYTGRAPHVLALGWTAPTMEHGTAPNPARTSGRPARPAVRNRS